MNIGTDKGYKGMEFLINVGQSFSIESIEDGFVYNNSIQNFQGKLIFSTYSNEVDNMWVHEAVLLTAIEGIVKYKVQPITMNISFDGDILEFAFVEDIKTAKDIIDEFIRYNDEHIDSYENMADICCELFKSNSPYVADSVYDSGSVITNINITNSLGMKFKSELGVYGNLVFTGGFVETETDKPVDTKEYTFDYYTPELNDEDIMDFIASSGDDIISKILNIL